MKDRRFLEMLNLYMDGELPPSEAAAFEKAMLADPQRRRVCDDYRRIHRATQLVCERFREGAAASAPGIAGGDRGAPALARLAERRRRSPFLWVAAAGSGLAACAAVVTVGLSLRSPGVAPSPAVAAARTEIAAPAVAPAAPAPVRRIASDEAARFAAAPEVRIDPYVIPLSPQTTGFSGADVFLAEPPWAQELDPGGPWASPAPFAPVRFESQLGRAFDPFDTRAFDEAERGQRVFRVRSGGEGALAQPVGYELRR
jgi:anti-sigma factor RsiW